MKIYMIFNFIVLLLIIQSCIEDGAPPPSLCREGEKFELVSNKAQSYFDFDVGSYWVFKDSINPEIVDTLKLISNTRFFNETYFEECGGSDNWVLSYEGYFYEKEKLVLNFREKSNFNTNLFTTHLGGWNEEIPVLTNYSDYDYLYGNQDTLFSLKELNNILYKDVVKIDYTSHNDLGYILYISKNIGIVKIVNNISNKKWELISYKLNKK